MMFAFAVSFLGSLILALFPNYLNAVFSLFLIGSGMAMLQVAINPLLREAGGEEHFAFNATIAQLIFGAASFLSPLVYSYLVRCHTTLPLLFRPKSGNHWKSGMAPQKLRM